MLTPTATPAHTATTGARALYLGARDKKTITCTAEALVVHNTQRQIRRYPLARISRVVSSTETDWHGNALALCLKSGIGITWIDTQGNALGTCYPSQRTPASFALAVELLTETTEGLERYTNWLRARRMEVLIRWGHECGDRISPAQWQATKHDWVYAQRVTEHLPRALYGHCLAWTGAQMAAHGLTPTLLDPQAQPIALDHDLCQLLWAEINLCAGTLAATPQEDEPTTALFERWIARNGCAMLLHLQSLCRTAIKAMDTLCPPGHTAP